METFININNNFTILNFNIRSFFKNQDEFLGVLGKCTKNIDVICLSETWLNEGNCDLCNISGYHGYHSYRTNKQSGGVSVFVKENISSEPLDITINNDIIECVGVRLKYANNISNVVGIYRPPSGDVTGFVDTLEKIIDKSKLYDQDSIIMGDFNICLIKENLDDHPSNLTNLFSRFHFVPLITKPTRIGHQSATLLDHIWVNSINKTSSGIVISDITDHYFVFSTIDKIKENKPELIKVTFRDFSEKNIEMFKNFIENEDWDRVLGDHFSPDILTDNLLSKLFSLYKKCFPLKLNL